LSLFFDTQKIFFNGSTIVFTVVHSQNDIRTTYLCISTSDMSRCINHSFLLKSVSRVLTLYTIIKKKKWLKSANTFPFVGYMYFIRFSHYHECTGVPGDLLNLTINSLHIWQNGVLIFNEAIIWKHQRHANAWVAAGRSLKINYIFLLYPWSLFLRSFQMRWYTYIIIVAFW
jgi:hypothetical protein